MNVELMYCHIVKMKFYVFLGKSKEPDSDDKSVLIEIAVVLF